jgi:hypothetical protein
MENPDPMCAEIGKKYGIREKATIFLSLDQF